MSHSIAIKGKYNDEGTVKNVTIATLSGVTIDESAASSQPTSFPAVAEKAGQFAQAVQMCVSATVTGFTISYDGVQGGSYGDPGDVLESAEIFSEDFSDTEVVPTLQIINKNASGTSKSFNFKYMADPINTASFDSNVENLASDDAGIGMFKFDSGGFFNNFIRGDLRFTAKDTITQGD